MVIYNKKVLFYYIVINTSYYQNIYIYIYLKSCQKSFPQPYSFLSKQIKTLILSVYPDPFYIQHLSRCKTQQYGEEPKVITTLNSRNNHVLHLDLPMIQRANLSLGINKILIFFSRSKSLIITCAFYLYQLMWLS